MSSYESMQYFIETSFHQDWDFEGPDDESVVRAFKARNSGEVPAAAAADIDLYLASEPSDAEVHDWLEDRFCAYDPSVDGLSDKEWLHRLADLLRSQGN